MDKTAILVGSAMQSLIDKGRQLQERSQALFIELRQRLIDDMDLDQAHRTFAQLEEIGQLRQTVIQIQEGLQTPETLTPVFAVSTEIIYNAFDILAKVPTESILYATGTKYGKIFTIERLIPLKLDVSEYGYARANFADSSRVLIDLEKYGTVLTAYFHTHPGNGSGANHPSGTDIANQGRLESGNYHTIGGIFSRDGYIRFFSDKMAFNVSPTGKGLEYAGKNLYRLTGIN